MSEGGVHQGPESLHVDGSTGLNLGVLWVKKDGPLPPKNKKLMPTSGPWALLCLSYLSGRPKLGRG